jgi:hypothetical protein
VVKNFDMPYNKDLFNSSSCFLLLSLLTMFALWGLLLSFALSTYASCSTQPFCNGFPTCSRQCLSNSFTTTFREIANSICGESLEHKYWSQIVLSAFDCVASGSGCSRKDAQLAWGQYVGMCQANGFAVEIVPPGYDVYGMFMDCFFCFLFWHYTHPGLFFSKADEDFK